LIRLSSKVGLVLHRYEPNLNLSDDLLCMPLMPNLIQILSVVLEMKRVEPDGHTEKAACT